MIPLQIIGIFYQDYEQQRNCKQKAFIQRLGIGDKISAWMLSFARTQVDLIYGMKIGNNPTVIAALLLFIICPAEEFFWKGLVQRKLSARWNPNVGFLVATAIYTLVHLPSLNFILIMAAMVCSVAWGGLYRLFPKHFPAIVISCALWDAAFV